MSLHVKIEICQADILNLLASDWKSVPPPKHYRNRVSEANSVKKGYLAD